LAVRLKSSIAPQNSASSAACPLNASAAGGQCAVLLKDGS